MPNTPGSSREREDITGTARCKSTAIAARRALRMRCRHRSQQPAALEKPQVQTANNRIPGQFRGAGESAESRGSDDDGRKGRLISLITTGIVRWGIAGAVRHPSWLPALTSNPNGTRNFTEAASQTNSGEKRGYSSMRVSESRLRQRKASTAKGGSPSRKDPDRSFGSLLSGALKERLLRLLDVRQRKFARFH